MAPRLALATLLLSAKADAHAKWEIFENQSTRGLPAPKWWLPTFPLSTAQVEGKDMHCLRWQEQGCASIDHPGVCKRSRDGRNVTDTPDIDTWGSPCVWCGDGLCIIGSHSKCQPLAFLQQGKEKGYFRHLLSPATSIIATCQGMVPLPNVSSECLIWDEEGCDYIREKNRCLRSRDGQKDRDWLSGNLGWGQPCVWCGGGVCDDDGDPVCRNFDFLMNGRQLWYNSWATQLESTFAACDKYGHPVPAALGEKPEYKVTFVAVTNKEHHNGKFITNGQDIWWYRLRSNSKHFVDPDLNCDECSCRQNATRLAQKDLDLIQDGALFGCHMTTDVWNGVGSHGKDSDIGEHFITFGGEVWHYIDADNSIHKVPPDMDCPNCGCDVEPEPVMRSLLNSFVKGHDYVCRPPIDDGGFMHHMTEHGPTSSISWMKVLLLLLLVLLLNFCWYKYKSATTRMNLKQTRAACLGEDSSSTEDEEEGPPSQRNMAVPAGAPGVDPAAQAMLDKQLGDVARRWHNRQVTTSPAPSLRPTPGEPVARMPGGIPVGGPTPQDIFDMIDADGDGHITREEWQRYAFNAFDQDHDGQVTQQEFSGARDPRSERLDARAARLGQQYVRGAGE